MQTDVLAVKLVSRLRHTYLADPPSEPLPHFDGVLDCRARSLDLGHFFWHKYLSRSLLANQLLDEVHTRSSVSNPAATPNEVGNELDHLALSRLVKAKETVASIGSRLPTANALIEAYRVLTRCVGIASRHTQGLQVHLARGAVPQDFDYSNLHEILVRLTTPRGTALQRYLED